MGKRQRRDVDTSQQTDGESGTKQDRQTGRASKKRVCIFTAMMPYQLDLKS
jgi:hypothetical protein